MIHWIKLTPLYYRERQRAELEQTVAAERERQRGWRVTSAPGEAMARRAILYGPPGAHVESAAP